LALPKNAQIQISTKIETIEQMQKSKISFGIVTLILAAMLITGCSKETRKARVLAESDNYFKAGDYDKDNLSYLNVQRLDPQNALAFQQLGFIWLEQGDPFRAVPFLLKVRELAPQNIAARAKLALSLKAIGQTAEARKEALSILQQDAGNAEAILVLADTSQSKEEIAVTEEQLQKFPQRETVTFHLASASLALRKGDLEGASNEVQKALAVDPKSRQAHLAMASIYALRKDPGQAGLELKSAADLAPVRSVERIRYAEFQAANGAIGKAKASLQEITKQAPDYFPAWLSLAQIALREKKYDESLSLLENIFSRDPDNPDVRLFQAEVLLTKGETEKATTVLNQLDSRLPGNPTVKHRLARAYLQSENPALATAALEQAVAANPNYAEAILALGGLNLRSGKPQPVVDAMEDLLKKQPNLWQARVLLANAYQALGRLDDATAALREHIKIDPQSPEAYFFLGLILRQQKKNDEARQAFEKTAELAPDNLDSINELVEMDLADKRYAAAMQRVQQEFQKKPNSAMVHFVEAKIYVAQKQWDRAESAAQNAIELDANFSPAYNLLISVYLAANKLPQAISQLQAGLVKDPNSQRALATMALIYEQMKDYAKASETYEKLLALNPNAVVGLNNLAVLYSERLNRLDRAYELAQKARNLQQGDGTIADTLGWILYKRGDYQQALTLLQESASKLPEEPQVQFHLGMTNYMMGQVDAARAAFERAAYAAGDFPDKNEAQRRLAQLQGAVGQTAELSATDLEGLLKQQPNDPIVLKRLAEAYEKQGDAAKAAAAYEQTLKLNPKLLSSAVKVAQLYAGPLQQPGRALEFAKKARELAPNDAEAAGLLGRIALETGNFSWAYSLLQESVRQRGTDPDILHDLALTAYALGKAPEARQTMQRSLDAAPSGVQSKDAKQFLAMTGLDHLSAEIAAAEPEVQKILKTQPDYVPALMAQAAIQLQRSDAKAATGIYFQVLRQYPDFAPAQKRLAAIYAENPDDLTKAYDLAMKARKTLSDDPELARTLAELNFKRKEFAYAIQLFQQSATKQPLPPKDLYYLGMAQLQTKQDAKGREALERALAAGLQDPLAQEAKQRLAESQPK
jgi:tetratricopeptide (TPR) repeat protein